ncbi:hypothetical protein [Actinophytocola sp.]|nr:hypothetical protein [Actinophytocola sp.]HYQ69791.1 hypothetical protein [Actinophytocola sp.]
MTRRWRDYEELVASVRALPGLSRILLPPALAELRPSGERVAVSST